MFTNRKTRTEEQMSNTIESFSTRTENIICEFSLKKYRMNIYIIIKLYDFRFLSLRCNVGSVNPRYRPFRSKTSKTLKDRLIFDDLSVRWRASFRLLTRHNDNIRYAGKMCIF